MQHAANDFKTAMQQTASETKAIMQKTTNQAKVIIHLTANQDEATLQQISSNVDGVRRQSPPTSPLLLRDVESLLQQSRRDRRFENGFLHQIPLQITTSPAVPDIEGLRPGSSRVVFTRNGRPSLLCCGYMGNVRLPPFHILCT